MPYNKTKPFTHTPSQTRKQKINLHFLVKIAWWWELGSLTMTRLWLVFICDKVEEISAHSVEQGYACAVGVTAETNEPYL